MDSKIKHRILAIVAIAGVAILAYPFMIGGNNSPVEQATLNPPAFPDQAIQVAANNNDEVAIPANAPVAVDSQVAANNVADQVIDDPSLTGPAQDDPVIGEVAASDTDTTITKVIPNTDTTEAAKPTANNESENILITPATPGASATPATPVQASETKVQHVDAAPVITPEAQPSKTIKKTAAKANKSSKKAHHVVAQSKLSKAALAAYQRTPIDNNGLLKLKKAAWVIQMGSFKNKAHALRLVNKLRAQGYRAFIQHVNVASGENTRVFVGPEHQEKSARQLAAELNSNLKLRGIVISYKPFTL